ncbi:MAG: Stp1/IreP family PP2C-type Ser/Thr phosphatase [Bacteroidetes bacterium]|nr:Stp1/IreP family PP2C-type Ser/Thr phosphatase [Bacteroidota bacterium]
MQYIHISLSKIGLKRLDNEDAFGIFNIEDGLLAIVCDGLGGNKAGEVASQLTVKTIADVFMQFQNIDFLERIKQAIVEANRTVHEKSSNEIEFNGMATTVEVLFLKDDTAYWGHVGDSRIYNLKNGKLKQLTKDHSLVQKLIDEGYLTLKEAENHPNKNIIMRALGDSHTIDIDLSKQKLNSKDEVKFFICTDGVTSVLSDSDIQEILRNKDPELISNKLSELIEERGAPDNYTFVLITKTD